MNCKAQPTRAFVDLKKLEFKFDISLGIMIENDSDTVNELRSDWGVVMEDKK